MANNKQSSQNPSEWLSELNPQQRKAVTHDSGPLLVVAGAGSGKTKTLAYRVAYLIKQGVPPGKILLLTFTRRAADEMLKRAAAAIGTGISSINEVWGGTFHAVANRLLRIYAEPAGLSPDFTIIDQSDAQDLMNVLRHEKGLHQQKSRFPRKSTCLAIYSRRVNGDENLEQILKKYFPWCIRWKDELADLFKAYVARKRTQQILDYDDLLLYWSYILKDPKVAESVEGRFAHILVDEYQDTNLVQSSILRGMRRENRNIMAVGDDAQSIYSFRAATVRNMLDFPQQFPGATTVTLDQNYRSKEPILATTNLLIAQSSERYSKDLWSTRKGGQLPEIVTCKDEHHQDEMVISRILEHYEQGISLRKQAVLFRTGSHSASLELELTRRTIPYVKYGGLKFLEAAHIKDMVSLLRILENPQDQMAWFRIFQLLEGVGPATAARAFEFLATQDFQPTAIGRFESPPAARKDFEALGTLFSDLSEMKDSPPAVEIDRITRFYLPLLKTNYENPDVRSADIEHLGSLAGGYRSRKRFLSELILDPPQSTGDLAGPPMLEEDWLTLSTIHSAKGCEWDVVFVIHAADGCIPSDMATGSDEEIQEELRLTYVAMTRARDFLYVLWPMRYYTKGRGVTDNHSYAQVCRFFSPEVLASMKEVSFAPADVPEDSAVNLKPSGDIGDMIAGMFD